MIFDFGLMNNNTGNTLSKIYRVILISMGLAIIFGIFYWLIMNINKYLKYQNGIFMMGSAILVCIIFFFFCCILYCLVSIFECYINKNNKHTKDIEKR